MGIGGSESRARQSPVRQSALAPSAPAQAESALQQVGSVRFEETTVLGVQKEPWALRAGASSSPEMNNEYPDSRSGHQVNAGQRLGVTMPTRSHSFGCGHIE